MIHDYRFWWSGTNSMFGWVKPILVDVASIGFQAHHLLWMWIDITPLNLLQLAYDLVP
jgi:hypothetical protein